MSNLWKPSFIDYIVDAAHEVELCVYMLLDEQHPSILLKHRRMTEEIESGQVELNGSASMARSLY